MPLCTSIAQRTASTTLRNSTRTPSPIRLTTRSDSGIDQIAAKRPFLVGTGKPAVSGYICRKNGCEARRIAANIAKLAQLLKT
jgi:hypothetical protein